ncbi:MAG: poly(A) polymerase [Gammaproteobacteria bacterium]|nr:poly(A) polymerase [Gammaproteobacteria bacterium]
MAPTAVPRIIPRSDHTISRSHISPNALRVLYKLRDAGFMAFLVGGCVRDLLIGLEPKDFDVATDALPEQVKRLFRNCRLVGRRFRLAHVFFGREIIEVATFRAASAPSQGEEPLPDADPEDGEAAELDDPELEAETLGGTPLDGGVDVRAENGSRADNGGAVIGANASSDALTERMFDETGRILRDNVYGTIDADVWRRDFTANSLYYNIADFSVWDYCDGVEDVRARKLKLIGDPETRFREDPVRMLRAARFEAKLGFTIDAATAEPIARLRDLLGGVPPARLFDETLKLFLGGHGERSFDVLRRRGLLAALLPTVDAYLAAHPGSLVEKLLVQGLRNTDSRVQADKPVTPTFLFALLLYGPIAGIIEATPPERWHELGTILDACDLAARQAQTNVAIPKRFSLGVREMFGLQPRLEHPRGRRALRVLEHPRFRAAYDLLLLRAQHGLAPDEMAQWWTRIQEVSAEERGQMADSLTGHAQRTDGPPRSNNSGGGSGGGRRRRGRRRRPSGPS